MARDRMEAVAYGVVFVSASDSAFFPGMINPVEPEMEKYKKRREKGRKTKDT